MDTLNKTDNQGEYILKFVTSGVLAFLGTYFSLPSRGLISTLPIFLIAALMSVLIKIPTWQKALMFGIFAYFFAMIDYDVYSGLAFATLCILTVCISTLAFNLFKTKNVLSMIIALFLIVICALPHAYFFGNYPEGYKAKKVMDEYIQKHYLSEDIIITGISYDYTIGYYKSTIFDKNDPTEIYSMIVMNNKVTDSYSSYAEEVLMNSKMLEITTVLREKFPDDIFKVLPLKITGYPINDEINIADTTDYSSLMHFKVLVPGLIDKDTFAIKSRKYFDVLKEAKINYGDIIFAGKDITRSVLTITVTPKTFFMDFTKLVDPPKNIFANIQLSEYLSK
ncbi:MAG: hypothetical protein A2Y15_02690 [Clostridiales bacterium GWF2_36_10]|nr:MAG: hypothetical protein A2Y15_02690 [Clostridiales bacterium GWF2_36_10]HAN21144.1 hypothetical protein [Clostridiales bacterium]